MSFCPSTGHFPIIFLLFLSPYPYHLSPPSSFLPSQHFFPFYSALFSPSPPFLPSIVSSSSPFHCPLLPPFFRDSFGVVADARVLFSSAGSHDTYTVCFLSCLLLEPQCSDSAFVLFSAPKQPHTASAAFILHKY